MTWEIQLTRFGDVAMLNAFIATRPAEVRVVFKTSRFAGLWQLDIVEKGEERRWTSGYYIDGLEDREIVYDVAVKRVWGGYVDKELDEKLHYPPYVVQWGAGVISVTLPHERDSKVVLTTPQICDRADHPLWELVFIWRDAGFYYILDCGSGLDVFRTREELEGWVKARVCPEGHERPLIHWPDWYVLPNVREDEPWSVAVKRAVRGRYNPSPDDVIELVRKVAP